MGRIPHILTKRRIRRGGDFSREIQVVGLRRDCLGQFEYLYRGGDAQWVLDKLLLLDAGEHALMTSGLVFLLARRGNHLPTLQKGQAMNTYASRVRAGGLVLYEMGRKTTWGRYGTRHLKDGPEKKRQI